MTRNEVPYGSGHIFRTVVEHPSLKVGEMCLRFQGYSVDRDLRPQAEEGREPGVRVKRG